MASVQEPVTSFRLAELLAALSLVADLGMGHAPEKAISACFVATRLARECRLDEPEICDIFYTTLLTFTGCTAYAHEEIGMSAGDDIAMRSAGAYRDFGTIKDTLGFFLFDLARDAPLTQRAGAILRSLAQGQHGIDQMFRTHCEVARMMAQRLGLDSSVQGALEHVFERWDGKGSPQQLRGDTLALPARFVQVAYEAILFYRLGGIETACTIVQQRAGSSLDPDIAAEFLRYGPALLEELNTLDAFQATLDVEPQPQRKITPAQLDEVALAFADVTDLKVPYLYGHARGVAELAASAARQLRWADAEITTLYQAALLHDIGRVGIANGIWEKPGPLTRSEWEQVRLHPYHTERILACSPTFTPLSSLAGMHHERLDGSGYYRQLSGDAISPAARLLAVADTYQAMTQARPYRTALTKDAAAAELLESVRLGQFDQMAVEAILDIAVPGTYTTQTGNQPQTESRLSRQPSRPGGLTEREIEVLALIARGATTKQVAAELSITPKTAGHHIQHIYDKIDVSTRAGAAMFAMQQGLV